MAEKKCKTGFPWGTVAIAGGAVLGTMALVAFVPAANLVNLVRGAAKSSTPPDTAATGG